MSYYDNVQMMSSYTYLKSSKNPSTVGRAFDQISVTVSFAENIIDLISFIYIYLILYLLVYEYKHFLIVYLLNTMF